MMDSVDDVVALNFDLYQDKIIQSGFEKLLKTYELIKNSLNKLKYSKRQQSSFLSSSKVNFTKVLADIDYMG